MNGDNITVVITETDIVIYLSHNGVKVASFKSIGATRKCIKRRRYAITKTVWQ